MIVFASCVVDDDKFRAFAVPGLQRCMEEDSVFVKLAHPSSIFVAYNGLLDHVASMPGVEAVVLLHEDVEILDPAFCTKARAAVGEPGVAVAGVIGATDVTSIAWWQGTGFGRVGESRGPIDFGGGAHDVAVVDGLVLVLSPWAIGNLRFDSTTFTGWHAYDADICAQALAAGRRVRVFDTDVHHHTKGGFGDPAAWEAANAAWQAKWAELLSAPPDEPGLNIVGYVDSETGEAELARQLVHTCRAAGIPHTVVGLHQEGLPNTQRFDRTGSSDVLFDTNIVCLAPHVLPVLAGAGLGALLEGRHTIGVWPWEVDVLPAEIAAAGARWVDEVWSISEHSAPGIAAATGRPVRTWVPTIWPLPDAPGPRSHAAYLFLSSFSFHSGWARKNPLGLVAAYREAFTAGDGAALVLKSIGGDRYPDQLATLRRAAGGRPDIHVIDRCVPLDDQRALMSDCDAYVSLHRCEGYGYTMIEAMALGKPVVATGYSGNLGFMSAADSLLVPYDLVEVGAGNWPYPPGAVWAEPDLDAASRALRHLAEDPESGRRLGERARQSVSTRHVPAARADLVRGAARRRRSVTA